MSTKEMSCSVDNFPEELFVVAGLSSESSSKSFKTGPTEDVDDDFSDLDSNDVESEEYIPPRVSFYPFNKCVLIPSRKELRHFKKDLWFTRRELNELREQDNKKPLTRTKRLSPRITDIVNKMPTESKWQFPTLIPKISVRSKLCDEVINLPPISSNS